MVGLFAAWLLRPLFHGLVMSLYRSPLVWLPPLAVLGIGAALLSLRSRPRRSPAAGRSSDPREDPVPLLRRPRPRPTLESIRTDGPPPVLIAVLALAALAFVFGAFLNAPLTARSIYTNTRYEGVPQLPAGGSVRVVPKDVATQITSSGFNSPTERLTDFHIVRTPRGLEWTSLKTPEGVVRTFSKKTEGVVSLDAAKTDRRAVATNARFQVAPGLQITDNLRWRLLKEHYLVDPVEPAAIVDGRGRPLIVVPYLQYRGFLIRRPVLGGVFVVHPDGRIEDLEPEEARARPEIAGSGRLYPDVLARRVQDAYAYKNGILNNLFLHEDQTQIADTESNEQPYLIDFGARGAKWVTVAEPYGRAFAVNAIFITDAVTGATQVWRVPGDESLSGNRRAIQTVRSVSIPGVVFAGDEAQGGGGGGRFRVVEPRPVFVGGRLVYLLSIIPESANSVSKSVIVDAASNKVIHIFDADTDPGADEATVRFLATGKLPGAEQPDEAGSPPGERARPAGERGGGGGRRDVERRLDGLIARQRRVLQDAEALRGALRESRTPGGR